MFISRLVYDNLVLDNAKLREESRVLNQQNIALQSALEWFMVRTTVIEKERGQLLKNYMGITLETPDYRPAPKVPALEVPTNIPPSLGGVDLFKDMGDQEAERNGIDWDEAGNVVKQ